MAGKRTTGGRTGTSPRPGETGPRPRPHARLRLDGPLPLLFPSATFPASSDRTPYTAFLADGEIGTDNPPLLPFPPPYLPSRSCTIPGLCLLGSLKLYTGLSFSHGSYCLPPQTLLLFSSLPTYSGQPSLLVCIPVHPAPSIFVHRSSGHCPQADPPFLPPD